MVEVNAATGDPWEIIGLAIRAVGKEDASGSRRRLGSLIFEGDRAAVVRFLGGNEALGGLVILAMKPFVAAEQLGQKAADATTLDQINRDIISGMGVDPSDLGLGVDFGSKVGDMSRFALRLACQLAPGHDGPCNPRDRMNEFPTPPRCPKVVVIRPKSSVEQLDPKGEDEAYLEALRAVAKAANEYHGERTAPAKDFNMIRLREQELEVALNGLKGMECT